MTPILFSGSSHPALAKEVASLAKIHLGEIELSSFPDHEILVALLETVKQRPVYVLQSLAGDPNKYLMELLLIIDALKRASAASITVVIPYYGYARQDRLNKPGVPIGAKLVADLLAAAGVDRVIVMDLHSEQIEGFFNKPVDQVLSRAILIPHLMKENLQEAVVVAPDQGAVKIASAYAKQLNCPVAVIDKERLDAFHIDVHLFIGDVAGKTVVLVDDMCSTGGTLVHTAQVCKELGAKRVLAVVGHGLFTGNALQRLRASPIEQLITTNSIAHSEEVMQHPKIRILSIAPLLARAMT